MKHLWLAIIALMLVFVVGWIAGYETYVMQIKQQNGVSISCNAFTSKANERPFCKANVTIPSLNMTYEINSNFDEIKVLSP